jgi:excisionase family DNA binding protein
MSRNKAPPIMTVEEAAEYLQLDPLTIRRLAREGAIPACKLGRQWRLKRDLLNRWLETERSEPPIVSRMAHTICLFPPLNLARSQTISLGTCMLVLDWTYAFWLVNGSGMRLTGIENRYTLASHV